MLDKAILIAAQAHLGRNRPDGRAIYAASAENDASVHVRSGDDGRCFARRGGR